MFSLGLASFFSVGAWLNSSAGSTLSHLLYFPAAHRDVRVTRHTYRACDPRIGRLGAGPPLLGSWPALGRPAPGAPLLAG